MVAAIRPDGWNLPLLVHIAGAMLLFGAIFVAAATSGAALRREADTATLIRIGFRTLLAGALPAYLLMRAGAEWIASVEGGDAEPAWIGVGYAIADGGLVLAVIATAIAWRASRSGPVASTSARLVFALSSLLLAGYTVAIWAMTTKPG